MIIFHEPGTSEITAKKCLKNLKVNPFLANILVLDHLKTPENQSFSGVFRGYKMSPLARNGLNENS